MAWCKSSVVYTWACFNKFWQSSMTPYGVATPHWVKHPSLGTQFIHAALWQLSYFLLHRLYMKNKFSTTPTATSPAVRHTKDVIVSNFSKLLALFSSTAGVNVWVMCLWTPKYSTKNRVLWGRNWLIRASLHPAACTLPTSIYSGAAIVILFIVVSFNGCPHPFVFLFGPPFLNMN